MQGVIDKVGFNRLFVPHQSPLVLFSLSLSTNTSNASPYSSNIVSFNPLGNPQGTMFTMAQRYNHNFKHIKRGSSVSPYPEVASVYRRSVLSDLEDDMFEDLYLDDMC
jgi:hypothetical protein